MYSNLNWFKFSAIFILDERVFPNDIAIVYKWSYHGITLVGRYMNIIEMC